MKQFGMLTAVAFSLFLFSTACSRQDEPEEKRGSATSENVEQQNGKTPQGKRAKTDQEKEEYQRQIETKLNELEKRIDELQVKAKEAGKEVKDEINKAVNEAELEKKKEAAKKKLEELKSASADTWDKVKAELDDAVEELEKAYERTVSYFRKE